MRLLRLVVGFDGSAPARAALDWAVSVGRFCGKDLHIVHVIDGPAAATLGDAPTDIVEAADLVLARALALVPDELRARTTTEIRVGPLLSTVAESAGDGDLLVIGTHKTGYLHGRGLRSRSLVIATLATARLAVVPMVSMAGRHTMVVGLEYGLDWAETVRVAALGAQRELQEVRMVHSTGDAPRLPSYEPAPVDAGQLVLAAASHLIADEFPEVAVRTRVSNRPAAEAFLDSSRSARVLVIGVPMVDRAAAFVGSVAHDVLLNLNCPVFVVPVPPALG